MNNPFSITVFGNYRKGVNLQMKETCLIDSESRADISLCDMESYTERFWKFRIIVSGVYTCTVKEDTYEVSEGTLIISGPNQNDHFTAITLQHTYYEVCVSDEKLHPLCVANFKESLYQRLCQSETPIFLNLSHSTSWEIQQFIVGIARMTQRQEEASAMCIKSVVAYMLGQVIMNEHIQHTDSPFSTQLLFIQNPSVFSMSAADIIRQSGYSRSQYLRKFKQETGVTLTKYLIDLRINYAKSLLQSTSKSILEIALEVGYDSVNYFIRIFREHVGVTPLQFRYQNQQHKE